MKRRFDPYWLALYLLVGGFLAGLWWVMNSPLTQTDQTAAGVCLVLVLSGLLHLWVGVSEAARLRDEMKRRRQRGTNRDQVYTYAARSEYGPPVSISEHLYLVETNHQADETVPLEIIDSNGYHEQSTDVPYVLRRKGQEK